MRKAILNFPSFSESSGVFTKNSKKSNEASDLENVCFNSYLDVFSFEIWKLVVRLLAKLAVLAGGTNGGYLCSPSANERYAHPDRSYYRGLGSRIQIASSDKFEGRNIEITYFILTAQLDLVT